MLGESDAMENPNLAFSILKSFNLEITNFENALYKTSGIKRRNEGIDAEHLIRMQLSTIESKLDERVSKFTTLSSQIDQLEKKMNNVQEESIKFYHSLDEKLVSRTIST